MSNIDTIKSKSPGSGLSSIPPEPFRPKPKIKQSLVLPVSPSTAVTSELVKPPEPPIGPITHTIDSYSKDVVTPLVGSNSIQTGNELVSENNNNQSNLKDNLLLDTITKEKQIATTSDKGSSRNHPVSNKEVTSNQPVIHREATSNELVSNREDSSNLAVSNGAVTSKQSGKQSGNELVSRKSSEFEHPATLPDIKKEFNIHRVKGHRKVILSIVYQHTDPDDFISDPIDTAEFILGLNTTSKTVKNVIALIEKETGWLKIIDSYSSPSGGWRIFKLPEVIYRTLDRADAAGQLDCPITDKKQMKATGKQPVSNRVSEPVSKLSNISISSNNGIIKENTNTAEHGPKTFNDLPEDWKLLDRTPLEELGQALHNNQVLGIYRAQQNTEIEGDPLTIDDIQESIYMMAHDIKNKTVKKGANPQTLLVGLLMKKKKYGVVGSNYISPQTLAAEVLAAQMQADRKRKEEARERIFQSIFENWIDSLTGNEINTLTPMFKGYEAKKATLKAKFRDEFYLTIRDNPNVDVTTLKLKGASQHSDSKEKEVLTEEEIRRMADIQFGSRPNE